VYELVCRGDDGIGIDSENVAAFDVCKESDS